VRKNSSIDISALFLARKNIPSCFVSLFVTNIVLL